MASDLRNIDIEKLPLSLVDDLTQLCNRRFIYNNMPKIIAQDEASAQKTSLFMIDVDNFKNFNDTHGHLKGDEALRNIAAILKAKSRKCDVVARYGGEEFVIIMPDTSKDNAKLFVERLRIEVERYYAEDAKVTPDKRTTMSAGIATYPEDSVTKDDLISMADTALYQAKNGGKNRVYLANKAMTA